MNRGLPHYKQVSPGRIWVLGEGLVGASQPAWRTALGCKRQGRENPKRNTLAESSNPYQGLGPLGPTIPASGVLLTRASCFTGAFPSVLGSPKRGGVCLVPSLTASHLLAWHRHVLGPFPGIYLELASCAAHDEIRGELGRKHDEHGQSQGEICLLSFAFPRQDAFTLLCIIQTLCCSLVCCEEVGAIIELHETCSSTKMEWQPSCAPLAPVLLYFIGSVTPHPIFCVLHGPSDPSRAVTQ